MITKEQLDHYRRYNGDADGPCLARDRAAEEASVNWPLITKFRMHLYLLRVSSLTSEDEAELMREIGLSIANEDVKAELWRMVDDDVESAKGTRRGAT